MKLLVVFCVIVVAVAARAPNVYRSGQEAQLLKYDEYDNNDLGKYRICFEQSSGALHEQRGELKNQGREDEPLVVKSKFSFIGPNGIRYTVINVADDEADQPDYQHGPGCALTGPLLASCFGR